jgi:hypothetical protein
LAEIDPAEIGTGLDKWALTFVGPDRPSCRGYPSRGCPSRSADPEVRHRTASGLWNQSLLDLLPRFAEALRTRFVDVRVAITDDVPVLVYGRPSRS